MSLPGARPYDSLVGFVGVSFDALIPRKASLIARFVVTTLHGLRGRCPRCS